MTTRSLKGFNARNRLVLAGLALVLSAMLAACSTIAPGFFERDLPVALENANIGVKRVEISNSYQGFVRDIDIDCTFDQHDLTLEQLKTTFRIVSDSLGSQGTSYLQVSFLGPDGDFMTDVEHAVDALNAELALEGDRRLEGDPIFSFESVDDFRDLVSLFSGKA